MLKWNCLGLVICNHNIIHKQVSVCKMVKNTKGLMRRHGPFVECQLKRTDTYSDVVEKISDFLRMDEISQSLCLYRPKAGALIPARELTVNKISVMWTLGAYM